MSHELSTMDAPQGYSNTGYDHDNEKRKEDDQHSNSEDYPTKSQEIPPPVSATQGQYSKYGEPPIQYQPPGAPVAGVAYIPPQPGVPGGPAAPVQMMPRPQPIPGVPAGLEYLSQIDQLLVHQQIEVLEMLTNWNTRNRYMIKNSVGQQVYFATEESDTCKRQFCGPKRGFIMHITDNLGQEVIRVSREFVCCTGVRCLAGSFEHCAMHVTVEAPVGQVIGTVKQEFSWCAPTYGIFDAEGKRVLGIQGPACLCQAVCCTADIELKVCAKNGEEIGMISKQWSGYLRERFTNADNFGINFPRDLDVRMKAVLLGAVFLIDLMYFE